MKVDLANSLIVGVCAVFVCISKLRSETCKERDDIEFKNSQIVAANNNQQLGVSRQLRKSKEKTDTCSKGQASRN